MLRMNVHLQEQFSHINMCMWLGSGRTKCLPMRGVHLWKVWRRTNIIMVSPNDPTLVVTSKPCQSAQVRKN